SALFRHVRQGPKSLSIRRGSRRPGRACEKAELDECVVRGHGRRYTVYFDSAIQLAHAVVVQPTTQLIERVDRTWILRCKLPIDDGGRCVGGKKPAIAPENDEVIPRDRSVGRIAVDDVALARRKRLVFHRRAERLHGLEVETVRALEARKSIGAPNEV